jgi:hypothetical protein
VLSGGGEQSEEARQQELLDRDPGDRRVGEPAEADLSLQRRPALQRRHQDRRRIGHSEQVQREPLGLVLDPLRHVGERAGARLQQRAPPGRVGLDVIEVGGQAGGERVQRLPDGRHAEGCGHGVGRPSDRSEQQRVLGREVVVQQAF